MSKRRASDVFVECLEAEGVKPRVRHPGRGDARPQRVARRLVDRVRPRPPRAGRRLHGRHVRAASPAAPASASARSARARRTSSPPSPTPTSTARRSWRSPARATSSACTRSRTSTSTSSRSCGRSRSGTRALTAPEIIPEVVRKAFKVAESEKPGADAPRAARGRHGRAGRRRAAAAPAPGPARARRARAAQGRRRSSATRSTRSRWPATASCARAPRPRCASSPARPASRWPRRSWARACSTTTDPHALGTVGLQSRDYAMAGFEDADVVIAIGYDLVEHSPKHWNPSGDKKIVVHRLRAGRDRRVLHPRGRAGRRHLPRAQPPGRGVPRTCRTPAGSRACATSCSAASRRRRTTTRFPMQPPRALWEIRQALGREDILISDVGLHKLWIGRMFPAHEPNTVMIANGLAGMGFAIPCAIAAKLVHPERKVVTVNGDGGFAHELPGARDGDAPGHAVRQRHLGEPPVRLDRVEAGQEVRAPLRHRLHEPRLRASWPSPSACPRGAASRSTTSVATSATP